MQKSKPFYQFRPRRKNQKKEESIQIQVCNYLKIKYPDVIFFCDASGIRLTMGQAVKWKKMRCSRGIPDLIILHPSHNSHFMVMEIKKNKDEAFTKHHEVRADKHIQEQREVLIALAKLGGKSVWGLGLQDCISKIDAYMKG